MQQTAGTWVLHPLKWGGTLGPYMNPTFQTIRRYYCYCYCYLSLKTWWKAARLYHVRMVVTTFSAETDPNGPRTPAVGGLHIVDNTTLTQDYLLNGIRLGSMSTFRTEQSRYVRMIYRLTHTVSDERVLVLRTVQYV